MTCVNSTDAAPVAVGADSQTTASEDRVFTAGEIPLAPGCLLLDDAHVDGQTQHAIENVAAVLEDADSSLADAPTVPNSLSDIDDFEAGDAVYETFDGDVPPARSTVGVDALIRDVSGNEAIAAR